MLQLYFGENSNRDISSNLIEDYRTKEGKRICWQINTYGGQSMRGLFSKIQTAADIT